MVWRHMTLGSLLHQEQHMAVAVVVSDRLMQLAGFPELLLAAPLFLRLLGVGVLAVVEAGIWPTA
jgi:hypothetical protein